MCESRNHRCASAPTGFLGAPVSFASLQSDLVGHVALLYDNVSAYKSFHFPPSGDDRMLTNSRTIVRLLRTSLFLLLVSTIPLAAQGTGYLKTPQDEGQPGPGRKLQDREEVRAHARPTRSEADRASLRRDQQTDHDRGGENDGAQGEDEAYSVPAAAVWRVEGQLCREIVGCLHQWPLLRACGRVQRPEPRPEAGTRQVYGPGRTALGRPGPRREDQDRAPKDDAGSREVGCLRSASRSISRPGAPGSRSM